MESQRRGSFPWLLLSDDLLLPLSLPGSKSHIPHLPRPGAAQMAHAWGLGTGLSLGDSLHLIHAFANGQLNSVILMSAVICQNSEKQ
jgi:hypothetical protein